MENMLLGVQVVLGIVLILMILIQVRGTGFGRSWGGGSFARRGLESLVFKSTFIVSGLFIAVSILRLVI